MSSFFNKLSRFLGGSEKLLNAQKGILSATRVQFFMRLCSQSEKNEQSLILGTFKKKVNLVMKIMHFVTLSETMLQDLVFF